MTKLILIATAALTLTACARTDSSKAANEAYWGDKPANITCWTYGEISFDGTSTGKILYDEGGRVSFVDATTGRYTVIEGDCRVVYAQ